MDPPRLYLITYPRTGSNLLIRMLGLDNQPGMMTGHDRGGYIFLPVVIKMTEMGLRKKSMAEWTEEEVCEVRQAYQACFDDFQTYLETASQKQCSVFIKEHVHFLVQPRELSGMVFGNESSVHNDEPCTVHLPPSYGEDNTTCSYLNETVLPDSFLRTWMPTFLIRHPALAFPSLYRALLELEGTGEDTDEYLGEHCMTMCWTRSLYDWYSRNLPSTQNSTWPIVLDADDIMTDPEVVIRFCKLAGLDSSKVSFSWTPLSQTQKKEIDPITGRYLDTLLASGGIVKGKTAGNINIQTEAAKWRVEFGEKVGERLERLVYEAMPDYEFLKARRLTSRASQLQFAASI